MYAVQPYLFQTVSSHSRKFQNEVEQLARQYSLKIDGGFPALELQVSPKFQALLEYTLWCESGMIAIKGKLQFNESHSELLEPVPVSIRFSISTNQDTDGEYIKRRVEEFCGRDVELQWYMEPLRHNGHIELSLQFLYIPSSGTLLEYTRYILGILTGRVVAA
ncbi:hypothetical protein ACQCN2_07455 [Brevibacillus ginsengisoli]|uniref:hypothetical protein n=1 Tax=Brevibacillus ginsengisoli TaxID=363854 RepID=UPI003CFA60C7